MLVVDNDPQGNLTAVAAAEAWRRTRRDLLTLSSSRAPETIRDVIVRGVWPGLDVVPTSGVARLRARRARDRRSGPGGPPARGAGDRRSGLRPDPHRLRAEPGPAHDQRPDGRRVDRRRDALKLFSANGLARAIDTIDSVRQHYNPLTVAGVIVNQHEEQTVSGRTWLDELHTAAESRGLTVLSPPIPKRVVISDALEAANGLDEWGSAEATALGAIYADHLNAIEGVSS